jgi:hypothetical protein
MRRHSFILTRTRTCGCSYCGEWQRFSSFWWIAILACKWHERTCEAKP